MLMCVCEAVSFAGVAGLLLVTVPCNAKLNSNQKLTTSFLLPANNRKRQQLWRHWFECRECLDCPRHRVQINPYYPIQSWVGSLQKAPDLYNVPFLVLGYFICTLHINSFLKSNINYGLFGMVAWEVVLWAATRGQGRAGIMWSTGVGWGWSWANTVITALLYSRGLYKQLSWGTTKLDWFYGSVQ